MDSTILDEASKIAKELVSENPGTLNNPKGRESELVDEIKDLMVKFNESPEETAQRVFRHQAPFAIITISQIMLDPEVSPNTRFKCAEYILARGIGPISKVGIFNRTPHEIFLEEILDA